VLSAVVFANAKAKRLAIRLTKWTGKSREYVHPKHLLADTPAHYWYLEYMTPGAALLDVGCGNGMHALKAARRCARVVGLDADLKIEYTLEELRDELGRNGFTIVRLHPSVYDTPLIGLIDVVGGLSLTAYRRLTGLRRRLAARWPEQNAGFYVVCTVR